MNKRPLVFMALIVLSGITCGIHDINRSIRVLVFLIMLGIFLFQRRGSAGKPLLFYVRLNLLFISLFILGYLRSDIEYRYLSRPEALEFYKQFEIKNPGDSDYTIFLKAKGISDRESYEQSKEDRQTLFSRLNDYAGKKLDESLSNEDAGILKAMLLGNRKSMSPELKNLYQRAGISHIISISGLHVSLAGVSFFVLLKKLGAGIRLSLAGASLLTVFYGALTGNAVSTIRAVIMLLIRYMGIYLGRGYDMLTAMAVSAVAIVFYRPYSILQAGFQLSFAAVLAICCVSPILIKAFKILSGENIHKFISVFIVSISIQLLTVPIVLYHYYEINIYSIFINLIIVPMASFAIYSGTATILCSAVSDVLEKYSLNTGSAAILAGAPAHYSLRLFKLFAKISLKLPAGTLRPGKPDIVNIMIYYIVISSLIFYLKYLYSGCKNRSLSYEIKNKIRAVLSFICLTMLLIPLILKSPERASLQIINLDVGQGDACLIISGKRAIMIDGGSSSMKSVADRVLKKTIAYYGINKLDAMIVSHADADHINGLVDILEEEWIKTELLLLPKPAKEHEKYERLKNAFNRQKYGSIKYLSAGDKLIVDSQLTIKCIQEGVEDKTDVNRHSSALLIEYGDFNMLSTGDAVAMDEERLIDTLNLELGTENIDFYKAAHHGSGGSNTDELIDAIRPDYVFFSCARNNRYGHPDRRVEEHSKRKGAVCLNSFNEGAVIIEGDSRIEGDSQAVKIYSMKSGKAVCK